MEYFKLRDGNKLPVIALGPGAVVRKEVLPYAHLSSNPIVKIGQKVVNKLIYEKESLVFINNVARGINLGFELIWGIERSGFFNGREKWAKGFENQRV